MYLVEANRRKYENSVLKSVQSKSDHNRGMDFCRLVTVSADGFSDGNLLKLKMCKGKIDPVT